MRAQHLAAACAPKVDRPRMLARQEKLGELLQLPSEASRPLDTCMQVLRVSSSPGCHAKAPSVAAHSQEVFGLQSVSMQQQLIDTCKKHSKS